MLETALFTAIRQCILDGFMSLGRDDIRVKQADQPVPIGQSDAPTVYMTLKDARRYGHVKRTEIWNADTGQFDHEERQKYVSTFQATAIYYQLPEAIEWTASDLANYTAAFLQSDNSIAYLRTLDVGILRVTEVRNPVNENEQSRWQAFPNFDFDLTHVQVILTKTPPVTATEFRTVPV